ncbi:thiamine kinase [Enterobacteriaceae bacterium H18W14]|uniref:thiamine kinase n=1 Tax=Dryocola boscaweniae TaxID=2925397 RepID=UPI0022F10716|nr:thiamine kinase [Dryocola boscaweniae]MCT4717389.1 thiamine kinase [Dryocola boscaweniae]
MQYSKPNNDSLHKVIAHYLPAAQAAGCFSALEGLSGGSLHFKIGEREYTARRQLSSPLPGVSLKRHYRALTRLPAGIGPTPVCLADGWLIVEWLAGEVKSEPACARALGSLLYHLHRQHCFGWRICLLPLLEYYWQNASPARRTPYWLRRLKSMKHSGEPKPLRLAPVHMDVHAGNLVYQHNEIKLIDWEYAGDADIALELAATLAANNINGDELLHAYAGFSKIDLKTLQRQVTRWRPWVMMLMASWYECRWRQTQDRTFLTLADEAWSLLRATNQ